MLVASAIKLDSYIDFIDATVPGTPSAGYGRLYVNSSKVYFKDSAGTSYDLTTGSTPGDGILDWDGTKYAPYTTKAAGVFYNTDTTVPSNTNRLNFDGAFYTTNLYSVGTLYVGAAAGDMITIGTATLAISPSGSQKTYFNPGVAAGSSAVAYILDTTNALTSGDKLFSIRNNGTEKFYISNTGKVVSNAEFYTPTIQIGASGVIKAWDGNPSGLDIALCGGTGITTTGGNLLLYGGTGATDGGHIYIYGGAPGSGTRGDVYFGTGAVGYLPVKSSETNVVYYNTSTGKLSYGISSSSVALDAITAPSGNTAFSMANKQIKFSWVAPTVADGAMELEITGAFTGDVLHIHQHTGNPGAGTHLIHAECADVDVVPLYLQASSGTVMQLSNPAGTYKYNLVTAAIGADRTVTFPLLTGNDTLVTEAFTQTLSYKTLAYNANIGFNTGADKYIQFSADSGAAGYAFYIKGQKGYSYISGSAGGPLYVIAGQGGDGSTTKGNGASLYLGGGDVGGGAGSGGSPGNVYLSGGAGSSYGGVYLGYDGTQGRGTVYSGTNILPVTSLLDLGSSSYRWDLYGGFVDLTGAITGVLSTNGDYNQSFSNSNGGTSTRNLISLTNGTNQMQLLQYGTAYSGTYGGLTLTGAFMLYANPANSFVIMGGATNAVPLTFGTYAYKRWSIGAGSSAADGGNAHFYPEYTDTYDIGTASLKVRNIYASGRVNDHAKAINKVFAGSSYTNSSAENNWLNYSIIGGTIAAANVIRVTITGYFNITTDTDTLTLRIKYGATTLFGDVTAAIAVANTYPFILEFVLYETAANTQAMYGTFRVGKTTAGSVAGTGDLAGTAETLEGSFRGTASITSSSNQSLVVSGQFSTATNAIYIQNTIVELL
jgi:hypothetical protein